MYETSMFNSVGTSSSFIFTCYFVMFSLNYDTFLKIAYEIYKKIVIYFLYYIS